MLFPSNDFAKVVNHPRCLRLTGLPCESASARQPHRDPRASGSLVLFTAVNLPLHPYYGAEPCASRRVVLRLPRSVGVSTVRFLTLVKPAVWAETAVRGNLLPFENNRGLQWSVRLVTAGFHRCRSFATVHRCGSLTRQHGVLCVLLDWLSRLCSMP
jgi:hypothetical protein